MPEKAEPNISEGTLSANEEEKDPGAGWQANRRVENCSLMDPDACGHGGSREKVTLSLRSKSRPRLSPARVRW